MSILFKLHPLASIIKFFISCCEKYSGYFSLKSLTFSFSINFLLSWKAYFAERKFLIRYIHLGLSKYNWINFWLRNWSSLYGESFAFRYILHSIGSDILNCRSNNIFFPNVHKSLFSRRFGFFLEQSS